LVGVPSAGDGVARLDGDFQNADSRELDPYPRITLDDLRERAFPHGAHDDCVDALSGAYRLLTRRGGGEMKVHVPRGRIPLPRTTTHPDSFGGFGG
jgi:phage terminase large subunit-like protein